MMNKSIGTSNISNNSDFAIYELFNGLSASDLAINIESIVKFDRKMPLLSKGVISITAFLSVIYNSNLFSDDHELRADLGERLKLYLSSNSDYILLNTADYCNNLILYIGLSSKFNYDLFDYLENIADDIKSYIWLIAEERIDVAFYHSSAMFNVLPEDNSKQTTTLNNCPKCNYIDYKYGIDHTRVIRDMYSPLRLTYAAITHSVVPLITGAAIEVYKAIKHSDKTTPLLQCNRCDIYITVCPICNKYISHKHNHPNFRILHKCIACSSEYKICGRSKELDSIL